MGNVARTALSARPEGSPMKHQLPGFRDIGALSPATVFARSTLWTWVHMPAVTRGLVRAVVLSALVDDRERTGMIHPWAGIRRDERVGRAKLGAADGVGRHLADRAHQCGAHAEEQSLLQAMTRASSRAELADQLFVSINTVKKQRVYLCDGCERLCIGSDFQRSPE